MEIDNLYNEIIAIQLLDRKIENQTIYTDNCYLRPECRIILNNSDYVEKEPVDSVAEMNVEYDQEEKEEINSYTYDEVMDELYHELNAYNLIYDVPVFNIISKEWDIFFETLAVYYHKENFRYNFMLDMVNLTRMTIARALVYEDDEINIDTYIQSLTYIKSSYLTYDHIEKIVKKIGKKLNRNLDYLITNSEGNIGCIGLGDTYLFIYKDKYPDDTLTEEKISEMLEATGRSRDEVLMVVNSKETDEKKEENQPSNKNNVISFNEYKIKRKTKK